MNVSVDCEARSFDPDIVRGQGSDSEGLLLQATLLNSSREYYRWFKVLRKMISHYFSSPSCCGAIDQQSVSLQQMVKYLLEQRLGV